MILYINVYINFKLYIFTYINVYNLFTFTLFWVNLDII